jgi:hypothetical protein
MPHFERKRLADIDLGAVMEWIDEQRAAGELGEASILHNMNLLSRFFSLVIARGKESGSSDPDGQPADAVGEERHAVAR